MGIPNVHLKTVIHFHPGGFIKGQRTKNPGDEEVLAFVQDDFTYISVGYRLVNKKYYWKESPTLQSEEEYIRVSDGRDDYEKGEMSLVADTEMSQKYQVKVGRQEFVTKCLWDAKTAMDRILEKTDWFMVDTTRVGFLASSAGGAEAHYCMWTFPRLYNGTFTPRSATFHNAQFDYTVQNMLDKVWGNIKAVVGGNKKLKNYVTQADCGQIVGNPWCVEESTNEVAICNSTWNSASRAAYCGNWNYNRKKIKHLMNTQTWPTETVQQRGLAYLWYPSEQMEDYDNSEVVFYVKNTAGGADGSKDWGALAHHATFVTTYMNSCFALDMQCIGYFPAYHGMKSQHQGVAAGNLRVRATHFGWNWRNVVGTNAPYGSTREKVDVHKYAMSL